MMVMERGCEDLYCVFTWNKFYFQLQFSYSSWQSEFFYLYFKSSEGPIVINFPI
jgi:hypothetical protein